MSSTIIEQSGLSSQKNNQTDTWNPPVPLTHGLDNENPYPFNALPNTLQQVVNAYCHRRLTLNLMMQPLLLEQMVSQATGISRQSGFLARCLLAYPDSSMGTRFYQEPPAQLDGLNEYEQRITDCLDQSQRLNQSGCINLPILKMSPQRSQSGYVCT